MSNRALALFCFSMMGCSSQAPTLRVDDEQATRIGAADRERLRITDERDIAKAREALTRGQAELTRAQEMVRAVAAERNGTRDPQLLRVIDVKAQWASTRLTWREVQVDCARHCESAAIAKEELDKAEIVSRNGVDLDVERFRRQSVRAHGAWSQCNVKLAAAHAAADTAEGQLAEAKDHYAHDRLLAAQPPVGANRASAEPPR